MRQLQGGGCLDEGAAVQSNARTCHRCPCNEAYAAAKHASRWRRCRERMTHSAGQAERRPPPQPQEAGRSGASAARPVGGPAHRGRHARRHGTAAAAAGAPRPDRSPKLGAASKAILTPTAHTTGAGRSVGARRVMILGRADGALPYLPLRLRVSIGGRASRAMGWSPVVTPACECCDCAGGGLPYYSILIGHRDELFGYREIAVLAGLFSEKLALYHILVGRMAPYMAQSM